MGRFARNTQVIYFEEPVVADCSEPRLSLHRATSGVTVAVPEVPPGSDFSALTAVLQTLLDRLIADHAITRPVLWFYTPMMFAFASHVQASAVVYDCMDELANFKFAPPDLPQVEHALMARADLMFTGGMSLYEAKRGLHANIHPFPSSVDTSHFLVARESVSEPEDQRSIPGPRLGFYGVVDERMDLDLLAHLARSRPDWSIVVIGPVVKIDFDTLPRLPNIHYLGGRDYEDLPRYLGGWDVALMPFAINDATRFISPTKTLEYLAGGVPVVSTPIRDVVRQYSGLEAVTIAEDADGFVAGCDKALALSRNKPEWLGDVDHLLGTLSWERTFQAMAGLLDSAASKATPAPALSLRRAKQTSEPAEVLVVGAGCAGSVMAERIASQSHKRVLLIDRRSHIGGNTYDHHDAAGLLVHRYGPHIFHTNSDEIVAYLSRFTEWRPYEHRVLACLTPEFGRDGLTVPMPINRTTINTLYGLNLESDKETAAFLSAAAEPRNRIVTSEDLVLSKVGRDLYERFFRGYTRKQWGMDPSALDKSVAARVPARTNTDDRYFTDSFQAMPRDGYTRLFERMLDHPLIEIQLDTDLVDVATASFEHVVFTGPIDEYFGCQFGRLPYRSLRFDHVTLDQEWFQGVGTVNYPDETVPFTRITEFKHLTGQQSRRTSIVFEHPAADGDPYYPVPRAENQALFKRYEALARTTPNVSFVGRLASYRYYNMDQVIGQALATYRDLASHWARSAHPPGPDALAGVAAK